MLAYRITEWEQPPELVETSTPVAGPGEILIKVAANGLCHSDATMAQIPGSIGVLIGWRVPFTLGHEIAGWIDGLGDGINGLALGAPVALVSPTSDGTCEYCLRGQDIACEAGLVGRGYGRDGGLASHVVVSGTRSIIPLGSLDPVVAGPLTDAGATSYHAVKRVLPKLGPGSTAVVLGAGGLGSFAVQHLRALTPARVIAVDPSPGRREFAIEMGAHEAIEGVGQATAGDIRSLTVGAGAEAVLDFVGIDDSITAGLGALRKFGSLAVVGAAGGTFRGPWYGGIPQDADVFTFQGSSISDAYDVIRLAEEGLIRSEIDPFDLAEVKHAYEKMERGELRGRAVVRP